MGCSVYEYGIYSCISWSVIKMDGCGLCICGVYYRDMFIRFMYIGGIYRVYIEYGTDELLRIYGSMWVGREYIMCVIMVCNGDNMVCVECGSK